MDNLPVGYIFNLHHFSKKHNYLIEYTNHYSCKLMIKLIHSKRRHTGKSHVCH